MSCSSTQRLLLSILPRTKTVIDGGLGGPPRPLPRPARGDGRIGGRSRRRWRRRHVSRDHLGVGQIDPAVLCVLRMNRHVQHPGVLPFPDLRRALDGLGQELALPIFLDDAQAAGTFGHEQASVGEERQAPGSLEPRRHDFDPERLSLGLDDLVVRIGDEDRLVLQVRRRRADVGHELPDLLARRACP